MRGFIRLVAVTALVWAALVGVSQAATEVGDAGDLPATAQDLGADGSLGSISGTLDGLNDRDVYRACLAAGGGFSASTVGGTEVDTQLFLLDADGRGVYANDDAPEVLGQSALPANDPLTPTAAGVYYLAVSRYNQDPTSDQGDALFPDVVSTVGPLNSNPIAAWTSGREGSFGPYAVALTGVMPCSLPDRAAPTIDLRTPADGATFALGEEVAADYDCADEDGGSGVVACEGTAADGKPIDTASAGPGNFTVTARDVAGNESTVTHAYTVVAPPADETAPTIDLRTPVDGAAFTRGQLVAADYDCADEEGGSGLATCVGDVSSGDPIDTSTTGGYTFTVTATDGAGNTTVKSVTYSVGFAFDFVGFLPPLDNPPALNRVRAGTIVAVRFRLGGDQGDDVLARRYPRSADVDCRAPGDADPADAEPTDSAWTWWRHWWGDALQYQPWNGTYVYLWKTERRWAGDCRQLIVKLSDGSIHRANVAFSGRYWGPGWHPARADRDDDRDRGRRSHRR